MTGQPSCLNKSTLQPKFCYALFWLSLIVCFPFSSFERSKQNSGFSFSFSLWKKELKSRSRKQYYFQFSKKENQHYKWFFHNLRKAKQKSIFLFSIFPIHDGFLFYSDCCRKGGDHGTWKRRLEVESRCLMMLGWQVGGKLEKRWCLMRNFY